MVEIKAPFTASLQITSRCNLRCKYCYGESGYSEDMPKTKIFEILTAFKEKNIFEIEIEGGEPFLHPDIFEVIEKCLQLELDFTILSNGTQINGKVITQIKKLEQKYYSFPIQISLDSHIPEINDLTRGEGSVILKTIERLIDAGFANIMLATVVQSRNIRVADKIIDYFYPRIKHFHFMNIMPTKNSIRHKDSLFLPNELISGFWQKLKLKKKDNPEMRLSFPGNCENNNFGTSTAKCNGCFGGVTRIAITPRADVIPCPLAPSFILGNLNENSFDEIWYSDAAEIIRDEKTPYCKVQENIILNNQQKQNFLLS